MKLSKDTLANLADGIRRPAYDRSQLSGGIVHVGLGNFHRAHQAVYLDDLFALGRDHNWAIIGAGVRAGDSKMRDMLGAQDHLSTVIELGPEGPEARVIGSMIDFLPVEDENGALIKAMADPQTRIVSLTVTEGGYFMDSNGDFDASHPDIQADAANPNAPRTVFGAIIAALKLRRDAGVIPFTVMCCDNLPGNGAVTRNAVTGLAALFDAELSGWIAQNVAFPNAMVDRITPATGPRERALAKELGLDDPAPVTCEPFRQWVLEDNFPAGRPALEEVGVTFTDDVHSYENMKIRILNGGHAVIAYAGALRGRLLAADAMADPLVRGLFSKLEREEILPHVDAVPDMTPAAYLDLIDQRFSNPAIEDTTRRLCLDGSNRQPKFIVPSVRDGLASGAPIEGLALVSALWCRYCEGHFEDGTAIEPNDPNWDNLVARARRAKDTPQAWLEQREVYGAVADDPRFADAFARWLSLIWDNGVENALQRYTNS